MMTGSADPACSLAMKLSRWTAATAARRLSRRYYCTAVAPFANAMGTALALRETGPALAPAPRRAYSLAHARDARLESAGRALPRPLGGAVRSRGRRSRAGGGDGGVARAVAGAGSGPSARGR